MPHSIWSSLFAKVSSRQLFHFDFLKLYFALSMSTQNEIIWSLVFISFCANFMRSVQNEFALIVGILYFISFCADGMRSVLNDKHFVLCNDR